MGQAFSELSSAGIISNELADKLRNVVGFRSIAVHNYQDLNWDIVYAIAHEKLADFKKFAQQIIDIIET